MKLYHDYKKLSKIFSLIILGILVLCPIVFSYAQTVGELNDKINQKNNDIAKLEQEIAQYQSELDDLGKQKDSLNGSIKQLDLSRKKLVADIAVTQSKIDKTNLRIKELSLEINDKQGVIANNTDVLALNIRKINEFEQNDVLATMLSDSDFTTMWNDVDNMISIGDTIRETTIGLRIIKGDLEDTRKETTDAKNELVVLKNKLADQKKIVDQNTAEKKKLLAQTKNSESSYQKLLKDRLAKKVAFEKELDDYESQLKYILDPSKLPNSGVLSWPLDRIYITSQYGMRSDGFHRGIDLRASLGTPVKAMADGVIAGVGNTDTQCAGVSFGRFILIKYNNGLASTFGHLSLIKVTTGDKVVRGQIVGYSGNTGYSTGPHLHISVYAKDAVDVKTIPSKSCLGKVLTQPIAPVNSYLNPMYYLSKI
ncbi:MAG: peptidoglycan DD-metalloendopeptidase family protein [Candidatus Paceibacterota bacterium]